MSVGNKREAETCVKRVDEVLKQSKPTPDELLRILREKPNPVGLDFHEIHQAALSYLSALRREEPYGEDDEACSKEQFEKDYNELILPSLAPGENFFDLLGSLLLVKDVYDFNTILKEVQAAEEYEDVREALSDFENAKEDVLKQVFEERLFPTCQDEERKAFLQDCLRRLLEEREEEEDE